MQHVKTVLFLACCLALGVLIGKGIQKYRAHRGETFEIPHTGIGNAPKWHGFTVGVGAAAAGALEKVPSVKMHATAVALVYPPRGDAGKELAAAVRAAHRQGLETMLLPAGNFSRENPYPVPLETVAREAEEAHVDCLCVSWLNVEGDERYWARAAADVRKEFHGKLMLGGTGEVLVGMESFEAFDYVGAIGPVRLSQWLPDAGEDVDLHALRVSWQCTLDGLENRALKAGKPLMLLNMVVPVTIAARMAPLDERAPVVTPHPEVEELAYEALVVETKGRNFTEGLFLPWSVEGAEGGAGAEAVNHFPGLAGKIEELWSPANTENGPTTGPGEEGDGADSLPDGV